MPSTRTIAMISRFQNQVDDLLYDYTMETGHLPGCPAEALTGIIRRINWGLKFVPLLPDRWAECDREARVIRVAADLKDRLEHPEQARQVTHSTIAHELAHAILHSGPRRSRTIPKAWEYEARIWAACFLVPWSQLAGRPELLALRGNWLPVRKRWARVQDLADSFQVTRTFAANTLKMYGLLERLPDGGIQAPINVIPHPGNPWRKSAEVVAQSEARAF